MTDKPRAPKPSGPPPRYVMYSVLHHADLAKVVEAAQAMMHQGWEPQGGITQVAMEPGTSEAGKGEGLVQTAAPRRPVLMFAQSMALPGHTPYGQVMMQRMRELAQEEARRAAEKGA